MMHKRKPLDTNPLLKAIHDSENANEDLARDYHLTTANILAASQQGIVVAELAHEFAQRRKAEATMLGRSTLHFTPPYVGRIGVAELGSTTSAERIDELDALKDEYHQLAQHLVMQGMTEGEIKRADSRRWLEQRTTDRSPEYRIVTRHRQLLTGTVAVNSTVTLGFRIDKKMVMSMPTGMLEAMLIRANPVQDGLNDPKIVTLIEQQIDLNHPKIYPIRTSYMQHVDLYAEPSRPIDQ